MQPSLWDRVVAELAKGSVRLAVGTSSLLELLLQRSRRLRDDLGGTGAWRRFSAQVAKGRASWAQTRLSTGALSVISPRLSFTPPQRLGRGLASFYEVVAFDTLRALWRQRLLIASFVAAGLVLAVLAIAVVDKRYSADAIIQLDFAREDPARKAPPSAAMDAAILVEGEARLIRSTALARRVVTRLRLEQDPAYASEGLLRRLLGVLRPPAAGAPAPSNIDLAARRLTKQLTVTNDNRSYLINITIMSNSPEWSATLANAFAVEYLNDRIIQRLREGEAAARGALADARATYGEKHPSVIQAKAQLAAAEARTREQETLGTERPDELRPAPGQSFLKAEPVWLPSGPNPVAFLGIGVIGSLLAAVALALLMERRDTGFRTEFGVPAETGIRCVGMIPRASDRICADRKMEQREALRSLCLTAGLAGEGAGSRAVMITSALPARSKSDFIRGLTSSLVEEGHRVLLIDTSPSSHAGGAVSLDDVLGDPELMRRGLIGQGDKPVAELRRASGLNGARNPFASFGAAERAFAQLLAEAKACYDVIVIDTPPAMLFADSIFLGRFADISLHVADWNETPRATVAAAVERLRENKVRVDGIVLTEVDLGEYPAYAAGDRIYYLSKNQDAFRPDS